MGRLRVLQELRGHNDRVWYVAWHPTGKVLATCSTDKTIRIWGPQFSETSSSSTNAGTADTGVTAGEDAVHDDQFDEAKPKKVLSNMNSSFLPSAELQWVCKFSLTEGHTRTIRSLAWSPDGRLLVSCGFDGIINVWQLSDGDFECVASLEGHENEVKSVAWSASGRYLATSGRDKTVWIWEAIGEDDKDDAAADEIDFECESVLHSHTQDVKKVVWHPNDDVLISTSYDDTVKFYRKDGDDWSCYDTLYGHSATVWSADMHPSGNVLVSASADKTLRFWARDADAHPPAQLWKPIRLCEGQHDGSVFDVKWNQLMPNLLATACSDNGVRVFRVSPMPTTRSHDATKTDDDDEDHDESFELEMTGADLFDALKSDFTVKLDAEMRQAHTRDCNAVAWYPSDSTPMLASAGDDGIVRLWLYESDETSTANEPERKL